MTFYSPMAAPAVSDSTARASLLYRAFEGSTKPTDVFLEAGSTMVSAMTGGFWTLNSGGDVGNGTNITLLSRRNFCLFGPDELVAEFWLSTSGEVEDGAITFGLGLAGGGSMSDGVYFRITSGATLNAIFQAPDNNYNLQGVIQSQSVETVCTLARGNASAPTPGLHRYRIAVRHNLVLFQIDDMAATGMMIPVSMGVPGASTQPIALNILNGAPVNPKKINLAAVNVYQRGMDPKMPWGWQLTGQNLGGDRQPPGTSPGQTAAFVNSGALTAGGISNTTAAYTGLGGKWSFNAANGAETDGLWFRYTVPAHAITTPGRNFRVTGVRIGETVVTGAITATTADLFEWGIGVGGSADPLGTADGAGTTAYRRAALGSQAFLVGSAIGAVAPGFYVDFSSAPLVAYPGQRVAIIMRHPIGTNTASVVFRGSCAIVGVFD